MGGGFLMHECQWFADKNEQAIQKSELFVQFFIDASSGLWNSLNIDSDKNIKHHTHMTLTQEFIKNQWHMIDVNTMPSNGTTPRALDGLSVVDSDTSLQNLRRRIAKTHQYNSFKCVWMPNKKSAK
jgi:hypothetical protein